MSVDRATVLKHLLRELTRSGDVVKIRGGRYGLPRKMSLVVGTLKCSPKGYGFVSPAKPGQLDVFVREVDMGGALHGDEVVIRQERHKRDGRVLSTVTK
jgi:ribonuclease R